MSYDGVFTGIMARSLQQMIDGRAKIEKIHQPEPDGLLIQLNTYQGRKRLLLSAQPGGASVYVTERTFRNPPSAPPFCMRLRKHILGGRLVDVRQPETERIMEFSIETVSELRYQETKRLIVEIMGKHSNIILVDAETNRIIDCIKHISIDVNRYRQLLPGLPYTAPPPQDKLDFWTLQKEPLTERLLELDLENPMSIVHTVQGISPSLAEEIRLSGAPESIPQRLIALIETLAEVHNPNAWVFRSSDGKPQDVHIVPLFHVFPKEHALPFEEMGQALDYFYSNRIQSNRIQQRSASLARRIQGAIEKQQLKKQRLLEELQKAEQADDLRIQAELLTANLHRIQASERTIQVDNYYDGSTMEIDLDPRYSPAQNAQRLYTQYRKARTAATEKRKQLARTERELAYLDSALTVVELARDDDTLEQMRSELAEHGYVRRRVTKRKQKHRPKPLVYPLSDGFEALVGRSHAENDHLTFSVGKKNDLWFHTKDIPGAHVLLPSQGREVAEEVILQAAAVAARHSKAQHSSNVPVDYTLIRHVRKPSGAKPGMVHYTSQRTVFVDPTPDVSE